MAIYSKGKRGKKKQLNKGKVVAFLVLIIIVLIIFYLIANKSIFASRDGKQTDEENITNVVENNVEENVIEPKPDEVVENAIMPEKMGNYDVIGELVIDKISVDKYILNMHDYPSIASLDLSVGQLCGPGVNEPGNFCIVGHNYKNQLKELPEMEVGDTFYIIKKETKTKVTYQIYDIYICEPKDLSCLEQNNDGKREVTLITCTPGGTKRLICKAREA